MGQSNIYEREYKRNAPFMNRITDLLHLVSDHGDAMVSKAINYIGAASIAAGGTNAVVANSVESQSEAMLVISDWAGIVSICGGLVFIFKLFTDMYFNYKKDKREESSTGSGDA